MGLDTLPGPTGLPVLGMALDFQRDPFAYAQGVGRHGDLVAVPFPGITLVYVLAPELVEQVLVKEAKKVRKGSFFSRVDIVFGEGILLAEGAAWKKQRRRMAPAFTHTAVQEMAASIGPLTVQTLQSWGDGGERDVHVDMSSLTLDVALHTLFSTAATGTDLDQVRTSVHDISAHFARLAEMFLPLPLWVPTPANRRFKSARAQLDGVVSRVLQERRSRSDPGRDLLGRLLSAADETGTPISESQLQDEVRTLLLAGHETTAIALTVALWHLAHAPDAQAWAREEVEAIDGPVTPSTPMPRITAVVEESMRLYPPAPVFPREPSEDLKLGDHTIPAGTTLILAPFITQRQARWFDEPDEWKPSRWTDELRSSLPRFAYFPFGGGARTCIGIHLAMAEARVVLAELLRRYRVSPSPNTTPLDLVPSITMRPREGVPLMFERL